MSKGRKTSAQPTPPTAAPKYGGIKVPVTVVVTQDDIDHGHQRSCIKCPIALALYRALGIKQPGTQFGDDPVPFKVVDDFVYFYDGDRGVISYLPMAAKHFVLRYDRLTGIAPEPLTFDLQVPVELVK